MNVHRIPRRAPPALGLLLSLAGCAKTGLIDDPPPDVSPTLRGAPFRLATAEPGGIFVSLTTERSRPVAVYCPPGCSPTSNLRLVAWDELRPDAPWHNRSTHDLPRGIWSVHAIRGGDYYAAHRTDARMTGASGWSYLARIDADTAAVTDTRWTLLTSNAGIVSLFGDQRSTELGVQAVGESLFSRFVVSPERGPQRSDAGCLGEVFGDTIATTCASQITLRGAHTATIRRPSTREYVREVADDGVFVFDGARNEFSLVSFTGTVTDLGALPTGIGITRYLAGTMRGVAACGGVCVHDRAARTWQRLLTTTYATAHGVFDEEANVIQTPSAFVGTNGVEVWVVPKTP